MLKLVPELLAPFIIFCCLFTKHIIVVNPTTDDRKTIAFKDTIIHSNAILTSDLDVTVTKLSGMQKLLDSSCCKFMVINLLAEIIMTQEIIKPRTDNLYCLSEIFSEISVIEIKQCKTHVDNKNRGHNY